MRKLAASSRLGKIIDALGFDRRRGRKGIRPCKRRPLSFEPLEDRTLLSLCVWDGGSTVDSYWNTAENWVDDVAPTASDQLRFQGSTRTSTENDFTSGTSFESIEFASNGFSLAGNNLELTDGITINSGVTGSTIALAIALDGTVDVNVVNTSLTMSGVVSDTGSLTKTGTGTLILSGENSYSGGTIIEEGTLQISDDDLLPTTGAIVMAGGTLDLEGNAQSTSGLVSFETNSGSVIEDGTLALTGYGAVVIDADVDGEINANIVMTNGNKYWSVADGKTLTIGGSVYFNDISLSVRGPGETVFEGEGGAIYEGYRFHATWGGTATFNSDSDLTVVNHVVAGCSDCGVTTGGAINWNSEGTLQVTSGYFAVVYNAEGVFHQTAGTVIAPKLRYHCTKNGGSSGYYLDGGELWVPAIEVDADAEHDGSNTLNFGGGTLKATGTFEATVTSGYDPLSYTIDEGAEAIINTNGYDVTLPGVISGSGDLAKSDLGTLTLSGANTYTGETTISGGTLTLDDTDALAGSTLDYDSFGGTLSFGSLTEATLGGLKGDQDLELMNSQSGAVALTVGNNGTDTTYSGNLTGGDSLTKTGAGTLTLAGVNNTYSGGTTISAGTLQVGNDGTTGTLGSGNVVVAEDATLAFNRSDYLYVTNQISGDGSVSQNVGCLVVKGENTYTGGTAINGGCIYLGDNGTTGTLGSGDVTIDSDAWLFFNHSNDMPFENDIVGSGRVSIHSVGHDHGGEW